MSAPIAQLEVNLRELTDERVALLNARTKEDVSEAARAFLEGARTRAQGVGGHVVSGHAVGDPLDDVLRAFVLSDPRLQGFLVEQAGQFAELTNRQRDSRLRKLGAEIREAEDALREVRKREAIERIERDLAPAGEAA